MNDCWLSVAEICTYLGIKRGTVYKWISEKAEDAVEGLLEKSEDLKKKAKIFY